MRAHGTLQLVDHVATVIEKHLNNSGGPGMFSGTRRATRHDP